MSKQTFVVIGAGQAGGWAVKTLRDEGFDGRILLFGNEGQAPYERPPLSKGLLTGATAAAELTLFSNEGLGELNVQFETSCPIVEIVPDRQVIQTALGQEIHYDKLLLCTGGRALRPPFSGADSRDVLSLRTLGDAAKLKSRLQSPAQRIVVVGAGWIGLEIAATARTLGHDVTVVEMADRACSRSVMPEVSERLAQLHESQGVRLLFNEQVSAIEPKSNGSSLVVLGSGQELEADSVILGAGLLANDELASRAGLACNRGVLVNASCQTSNPHIYAAGDVAVIQYQSPAMQCRLESWQNAQDQGIAAARAMLGNSVSYQPVPLVWSEQYDAMIQIAGHPHLANKTVVRNSVSSASTLMFGLDNQNCVVTVVGLNAGRDYRFARKLVEGNVQVDPATLADVDVALNKINSSAPTAS